MSKYNVVEFASPEGMTDQLSELICQGARKLIQQGVEAELAEFLKEFQERKLRDGPQI